MDIMTAIVKDHIVIVMEGDMEAVVLTAQQSWQLFVSDLHLSYR